MAVILVVDDEKKINDLISMNLEMVGHRAIQAFTSKEALEWNQRAELDLVLLDIMLPELDGYELLPYFMKKQVPVIYLTAKDSLMDKVKGLKLGADDYVTKPFESIELLARVETVLRRCGRQEKEFCLGEVTVNFAQRKVFRGQNPVELTAQEFALLEVLIRNCNLALSREQLLEQSWGYVYEGETRTVDIHIQRLRKKLGWEKEIETVYKYGYRLGKTV